MGGGTEWFANDLAVLEQKTLHHTGLCGVLCTWKSMKSEGPYYNSGFAIY